MPMLPLLLPYILRTDMFSKSILVFEAINFVWRHIRNLSFFYSVKDTWFDCFFLSCWMLPIFFSICSYSLNGVVWRELYSAQFTEWKLVEANYFIIFLTLDDTLLILLMYCYFHLVLLARQLTLFDWIMHDFLDSYKFVLIDEMIEYSIMIIIWVKWCFDITDIPLSL